MTTYFEYRVNLTDNQNSKLASAIRNKSPLTLRLRHSNLGRSDELMLTKWPVVKIKKSLANGTETDVKISKTNNQISKTWWKLIHVFGISGCKGTAFCSKRKKAFPALATGAVFALGELGINKIFGKGISIPQRFIPMLPPS